MALTTSTTNFITLVKQPAVLNAASISKSTLYNRISDGLFCPPVSLGGRAVGFVEHEVQAVLKAMVAGYSHAQIRELVSSLLEQRKLVA